MNFPFTKQEVFSLLSRLTEDKVNSFPVRSWKLYVIASYQFVCFEKQKTANLPEEQSKKLAQNRGAEQKIKEQPRQRQNIFI